MKKRVSIAIMSAAAVMLDGCGQGSDTTTTAVPETGKPTAESSA